jgi:hypothetical protein
MDTSNPSRLIGEVEEQRRRARKALGAFWFPLMLFGGFALIAALTLEVGAPPEILGLWIGAGPVGIVAISIYYGRRTHRIGLGAPPLPYMVTGLVLGLGAGLSGWLGRDTPLGYAGPMLVIGAGYLVFACLQRSSLASAFALVVMVAAIGFYILQPPHALSLSLGFFGLGSLLVGAWNLRESSNPK